MSEDRFSLRRLGVRTQLALLLLVAMTPAAIFAIMQTYAANEDVRTNRVELLTRAAVAQIAEERDALIALRGMVETLSRLPAVRDVESPSCGAALTEFVEGDERFSLAAMISPGGVVKCSSPLPNGRDRIEIPEFRRFVQNPRFTLLPRPVGELSGEGVIVALWPIFDEADQLQMALSLSMRTEHLRRISAANGAGDSLRIAIVDENARVIATHSGYSAADWWPADQSLLTPPPARNTSFEARSASGRRYVYVAGPVAANDLWFVAGTPAAEVFEDLGLRHALQILTPFLLVLIGVLVAFFAAEHLIARHIVYLERVARAYGLGRLSIRPRQVNDASSEIASLGHALGNMADQLNDREQSLRRSARENRLLLLEVHHRVKNNLQMIASLLNMEIRRSSDAQEQASLKRVQNRIHGIALVHQTLYTTGSLELLSLKELLSQLIAHQAATLAADDTVDRGRVHLDDVVVTVEQAFPVALLTTEALVNAFKHGKPGGEYAVRLKDCDGGRFLLEIENEENGRRGSESKGGLGEQLILGFARQLGARVERRRERGRYILSVEVTPRSRLPDREQDALGEEVGTAIRRFNLREGLGEDDPHDGFGDPGRVARR